MPLDMRYGPKNSDVGLYEEDDAEGRALKEFAGLQRVYWTQCPRCRVRLWYALRYDTGATEVQYFGRSFRQRMLAESCRTGHSREPLPNPAEPDGAA